MGYNPIGSNGKPRSALVFDEKEERNQYKNAIADIAASRNTSPSQAVLALTIESLAEIPEARDIARTMYASEHPRCLYGLQLLFQDLVENGEDGLYAFAALNVFRDLAFRLGLCIDTTGEGAEDVLQDWTEIAALLEDASRNPQLDRLAFDAHFAKRFIIHLGSGERVFISNMLGPMSMRKSWGFLYDQPCAHRLLRDLAHMAFPTRRGVRESADDRLAFLRAADVFYASGDAVDV